MYVEDSVRSVQAQTYTDWELLITDDCSSDDTWEKLLAMADGDARIKPVRMSHNSGAGAARNEAIARATGRYIAFLDSDDCWLPNKLELQLKLMRRTGAKVCYGSYAVCNDGGSPTGILVCRPRETRRSIRKDDKMGFLTVIYDTETLGKQCMPTLRKRQDWGLKMHLLDLCGEAVGVREPVAVYREREGSLSRNKWNLVRYNIAAYREVLGWSQLHATAYFLVVFMPHYLAKKVYTYVEKGLFRKLDERTDGFLMRSVSVCRGGGKRLLINYLHGLIESYIHFYSAGWSVCSVRFQASSR